MTPAAARQRRRRERQRRCSLLLTLELDADVLDDMVDAHCLGDWDRADKAAVSKAILSVIKAYTRHVTQHG